MPWVQYGLGRVKACLCTTNHHPDMSPGVAFVLLRAWLKDFLGKNKIKAIVAAIHFYLKLILQIQETDCGTLNKNNRNQAFLNTSVTEVQLRRSMDIVSGSIGDSWGPLGAASSGFQSCLRCVTMKGQKRKYIATLGTTLGVCLAVSGPKSFNCITWT